MPTSAPEPVKSDPVVKDEAQATHTTSSENTLQDASMNEMNDNSHMQNGYGEMNVGMNHEDSGMHPDESYDHEPIGMKEDG